MKHSLKVTLLLVLIFFIAQIFGLITVNKYIEVIPAGTEVDGTIIDTPVIIHEDTLVGPAPEFQGPEGLITVIIAVIMGTSLLLILAKFKKVFLWKVWFFISVFVTSSLALEVYVPVVVALSLALVLAFLKFYHTHVAVYNFVEVLMYTGIAILFVSFFDLFWVSILLVLISVYDVYAVWKSQHMVTLAKFTMESNMFAGLSVPTVKKGNKKTKSHAAILGGGDIAFPLIFSSVAMENFIVVQGTSLFNALLYSCIITATTSIALFLLLWYSKKDTFYPAMPFLSAGCFLGLGIIIAVV